MSDLSDEYRSLRLITICVAILIGLIVVGVTLWNVIDRMYPAQIVDVPHIVGGVK